MSGRLVVHLAPFLQGGAGRAIATLACAQRLGGDEVVVATSKTAEPGFENYAEYLEAIARSGAALLQVDSLFKRNALLNAAAEARLRAVLRSRLPDVVHAHAAIPARIGMTLCTPIIQTMHGWSRNKSAEHTAEDLGIMSGVDLVVFPSRASQREVEALGGRFRGSAIVPNGISAALPDARLPNLLDDLPARRAGGGRILVSIGSLTPQKNQAVLVDALPAIARLHDVVAVFVGEGPEIAPLRSRAAALGVAGRVRFCGYVKDAAAVLTVADLLVQPSLAESFGVAVVEAFRAGVPVAASRQPALSELVHETGCGWAFDASSPASLADAVVDALGAPESRRVSCTTHARQLFLDRFTDDRMIAAYNDIYQHVRR